MATRRKRSHTWLDGRSRFLHRAVAERIREDPSLISIALENLDRWERSQGPQPAFSDWRRLLETQPLERILELLEEDSEEANRLRQSSPFAGILSQEERAELMRRYEAQ